MLFKRCLTIWFLLFTLLSSAAWAVTDHNDINHGSDLSTKSVGAEVLASWSDDGCPDHCDHASVHIVGLIGLPTTFSQAAKSPVTLVSISELLSRAISPLYHPPII